MNHLLRFVSYAIAGLFLLPVQASAAPRSCDKAAKIARSLKEATKKALYYANKFESHRKNSFGPVHTSARSLQKPIVRKFADHFKKEQVYTKWQTYKLRPSILQFLRTSFRKFKVDFKDLKGKGFDLNKLKKNGFKFGKSASLEISDNDMAPCGLVKLNAKALSKVKMKFSKSKLMGMSKLYSFLKLIQIAALRSSITKTNSSIALAKTTRSYGAKARYWKAKVKSLLNTLKRYANSCKRDLRKAKKRRRRSSLDHSPVQFGLASNLPASQSEEDGVCNTSFDFTSDTNYASSSLSGPTLGAGFEINFQTVGDQLSTDQAYNGAAQDALDASTGL